MINDTWKGYELEQFYALLTLWVESTGHRWNFHKNSATQSFDTSFAVSLDKLFNKQIEFHCDVLCRTQSHWQESRELIIPLNHLA